MGFDGCGRVEFQHGHRVTGAEDSLGSAFICIMLCPFPFSFSLFCVFDSNAMHCMLILLRHRPGLFNGSTWSALMSFSATFICVS